MQDKKIYGVPLVVARRINEDQLNINMRAMETVLARMDIRLQQVEWRQRYRVNEDWHRLHKTGGLYDKGCGCDYCLAIHKYVSVKVSAHRLRRRLDSYDYMCRPYESPESFKHLRMLDSEWPGLRKIKETMRMLAGL